MLADLLERYAFAERDHQKIPVGWAARTLHAAGADRELVLDVFDASFHNRQDPWSSRAGLAFLLADIAALVQLWLDDALHSPQNVVFPAKRVDEAINAYTISIRSMAGSDVKGGGDIPQGRQLSLSERKLKQCQEQIRMHF